MLGMFWCFVWVSCGLFVSDGGPFRLVFVLLLVIDFCGSFRVECCFFSGCSWFRLV